MAHPPYLPVKGTEVMELSVVLVVLAAFFLLFFRVKETSAVKTTPVTSPTVKLLVTVELSAFAFGQGMLQDTLLSGFDAVSPE